MSSLPTLNALLVDELQDLLHAENQLLKALPKMAKAATNPKLKEGFNEHLAQTRGQVDRLAQSLKIMGLPPKGKTCHAMLGNAVTEWTATFERLQADLTAVKETAAAKAREAADTTASALATVSLWSFFGFLLGALAAAGGGLLGAKSAMKCEEETTDIARSAHDTSGRPIRQGPVAET